MEVSHSLDSINIKDIFYHRNKKHQNEDIYRNLVAVTVTQAGILETKSRNQKARPRGSDAPMDVKVEAVEPEIEPEDEPEDEPEPESFPEPFVPSFPELFVPSFPEPFVPSSPEPFVPSFPGPFPFGGFPEPEPEWG